ncbi:MAG: serine protease, partial [Pseudomonadota bacterium]
MISWVLTAFAASVAAELPDTLERIKPSIVAIGTYQKTRSPPFVFRGTGFIVGDGTLVATNAHVVPEMLKTENGEALVVIANPARAETQVRQATLRASDKAHDLALLRISGAALPALTLHDGSPVREGQEVA